MDKDNRRSERFKAPFFVRIGYQVSDKQKKWEENSAKNVSTTGLAINTANEFEKGTVLTVLLRIPTNPSLDWLETYGKIVDCSKISDRLYVTRIEFVDLSPKAEGALKQYVAWASKHNPK